MVVFSFHASTKTESTIDICIDNAGSIDLTGFYSQLRQEYLNHYFQAKVGKELPKQFPEPLSIGKLDVGNFCATPLPQDLGDEILRFYPHPPAWKTRWIFGGEFSFMFSQGRMA